MWFKIFFFITQYIIYNKNGLSYAMPMIGNVRTVTEGQLLWVVSIKRINNTDEIQERYHGITGSLVSNKHVVTVAHGISQMPLHLLEVRLGTNDIRDNRYRYNISNVITFNQWSNQNQIPTTHIINDISVVTLATEVPDSIQPVVLSPLPEDMVIGLKVHVAGWGLGADNTISRYMKYGTVKIITREQCKNRIFNGTGERTNIHRRFLCSYAEPYVILRSGDSGGPVFLPNGELVAITHASCPSPDGYHPLKINIHIGIRPYRYFIANIITRN